MHSKNLFSLPGVVGVGKGKKWRSGSKTDEDAIVVFVEKKRPLDELKSDEVVPSAVDEVQTDVVEIGVIEPAIERKGTVSPLVGGISIGHPDVTAGSLGVICYDKSGTPVILSNAHVAAPHWKGAKIGDSLLQPGRLDSAVNAEIGTLANFVPINFEGGENKVDAAICKIGSDYAHTVMNVAEMGVVGSVVIDVEVGDVVRKSGRTTGLTTGEVIAIGTASIRFTINGEVKNVLFQDQVFVKQNDYSFIAPGDSGSLVVDKDKNPCGLVFAASPIVGIFNKMQNVVDALSVSFKKPDSSHVVWKGSPNMWFGREGHKPEAIVIHIMDGTLSGTDAWFMNPQSNVSAHYGIGKAGEVHQYVKEENSAWHSGRVEKPTWSGLKNNINPNRYTIGIEHEGTAKTQWSDAMKRASAKLIAEICKRWDIQLDRNHIIGHNEINSVSRAHCPSSQPGIIDELISLARLEGGENYQLDRIRALVDSIDVAVTELRNELNIK